MKAFATAGLMLLLTAHAWSDATVVSRHPFERGGAVITTSQLLPPYMDPLEPCPCHRFHVDFIPPGHDNPTASADAQVGAGNDGYSIEDGEHPRLLSPAPASLVSTLGQTRPPGWGVLSPLNQEKVDVAVVSPDNRRVGWRLKDGTIWVSRSLEPPDTQVLKTSDSSNLAWNFDSTILAVGATLVHVSDGAVTHIPTSLNKTIVHWVSVRRAVLVDTRGTLLYDEDTHRVRRVSRGFIPRVSPNRQRFVVAVGPDYDQFAAARPGPLSRARIEVMRADGEESGVTVAPGYQAEWIDDHHVAVLSLQVRGDSWTPVLTVYKL